jgi:hypothetical protein
LYLISAQQHTAEEIGSPALLRKQIQFFHGAFFVYCTGVFAVLKKDLQLYRKYGILLAEDTNILV